MRAFRILVQTYRHYIFQIIFAILRHEEDAKDVTQEVFVKFMLLPNSSFRGLKRGWRVLPPITLLIIRERKQRKRRTLHVKKLRKSSHNIEALLLTKEQKLIIAQKLRELPENYRDVVLAHYLEEKLSRNCFTGKH